MTRQMTDDEVLRVLDDAAIQLRQWQRDHGQCIGTMEVLAKLREARPAVAALQAERDALRAEEESSAALIQRQSDLLTGAVNVLRGDPPPLTLWSHHDVAELARAMKDRAERAESALEALHGQVAGLLNTCVDVIEEGLCARQSYDYRARAEGCAEQIKELLTANPKGAQL